MKKPRCCWANLVKYLNILFPFDKLGSLDIPHLLIIDLDLQGLHDQAFTFHKSKLIDAFQRRYTWTLWINPHRPKRVEFEFCQGLSATPQVWLYYSQNHRDPSFWLANQQGIIFVRNVWTSGSRDSLAKIWLIPLWQIIAQFRHLWRNNKHSVSTYLLIRRLSSGLY